MFDWWPRDPVYLTDARKRMAEALQDYPIYEPPHRQGPCFLRQANRSGDEYIKYIREFVARGKENFDYFMEHRSDRLAALRSFLAKFEVLVELNDAGVEAVSAWCPGRCGALVADLRQNETRQIFYQMLMPWVDQWRGFNVIFDLGVFIGESIIMKNHRFRWKYEPGASNDGSTVLSGYSIDGFSNKRDWLDPIVHMYSGCLNDEHDLRSGQIGQRLRPTYLTGTVRDFSAR